MQMLIFITVVFQETTLPIADVGSISYYDRRSEPMKRRVKGICMINYTVDQQLCHNMQTVQPNQKWTQFSIDSNVILLRAGGLFQQSQGQHGPHLLAISALSLVFVVSGDLIRYYERAKGQRPRRRGLLTSSDRKTSKGILQVYS
uniref:Uncharacterized protein n=1 Tax=Romanomermis culicivorax TaxID=13658 RepID=A0A915K9Q7_ROMCU